MFPLPLFVPIISQSHFHIVISRKKQTVLFLYARMVWEVNRKAQFEVFLYYSVFSAEVQKEAAALVRFLRLLQQIA